MGKSLGIGTYFGIPVKLHWTFFLLIPFILYTGISEEAGVEGILFMGIFVLLLFLCVTLHEYGHALMARRYGVSTRDIILSPIGGIARLNNMPEKPFQEFMIAIAGPLVNVVIASILAIFFFVLSPDFLLELITNLPTVLGLSDAEISTENIAAAEGSAYSIMAMLVGVFAVNIMLVLFNLVPAFPMDGGRIFRSLLAMRLGRLQATKIASYIGRAISILFVGLALYYNHMTLGFIGVFIYFMASQEYRMIRIDSLLDERKVSDIMRTNFEALHYNDSISHVHNLVQDSPQDSFFVLNDAKQVMGILRKQNLLNAMEKQAYFDTVYDFMSPHQGVLNAGEPIRKIYNLLLQNNRAIFPVYNECCLVGIVDVNTMNQFFKENR